MSKPYLTFVSASSFAVERPGSPNGIIEFSTDTETWFVWEGQLMESAEHDGEYRLYLRGIENTTFGQESFYFATSGEGIRCEGNIENLLNYMAVEAGEHPPMDGGCFLGLFRDCYDLLTAPELPATTLTAGCYRGLFSGCGRLTKAPELPATELAATCYALMFAGCVSLTTAPELPATILPDNCYREMFANTGIVLSATQTDEYWKEYRIPSGGVGVVQGTDALTYMFPVPGNGFSGTPEINTIYYMAAPREEEPPTDEVSIDKKSMLMGWLVGRRIVGHRKKA